MKEQVKNNFSQCAETYDFLAVVQKKSAVDLVGFLDEHLYQKILDVGCGTGFVIKALEQEKKVKEVVGIDFAKNMQAHCQKKWPNYQFICGDAEKDFHWKDCDLIISNFSLHWFENAFFFIKNCVENLGKKGVLALAFPVEDSLKDLEDWSRKIVGKKIFLHPFLSEKKLLKSLDSFSCSKKNIYVKSQVKNYEQSFENPWKALCAIKKIGASYANEDSSQHRFSIREMRCLKASALEMKEFKLIYKVLFLLIKKKDF